jgi:transposase InsO family protein
VGGKRGRLIPLKDKIEIMCLIQEAINHGASISEVCKTAEISRRTFERWKKSILKDKRKGSKKKTAGKLQKEKKDEIVNICCNHEFKDSTPAVIYVTLLERGIYLASISTIYRVLRERNLIHHRTNRHAGTKQSRPPEVKASGPNQVWAGDITWLQTEIKGLFLYLYTIIDIWDKKIVGWQIHEEERREYSDVLFRRVLAEQGYPKVHLHSDNGNPMKGASLLAMLYELGCVNSYSRPRVSNDNAFIESFFGRMKTSIKYPSHFKSRAHAQEWVANFLNWYNTERRHSGIQYFTPEQMRTGKYKELVRIRNATIMKAYKENPSRWRTKPKQWTEDFYVYLNPYPETRKKLKKVA